MKYRKAIEQNHQISKLKDSDSHLSNAEIDKMAKEWVELVIDNLMCPVKNNKDKKCSPLSFSNERRDG